MTRNARTEPVDPRLVEDAYPLQDHMGFSMTHWSKGYTRFEQPMEPYLLNRHGIPHGGVYGLLLDTVMGSSGCWTGVPDQKIMAMTLSMTVNYLSRPKGSMLIAQGWTTGGGKRTFFAEGRLEDETGELIATSVGTMRYRAA